MAGLSELDQRQLPTYFAAGSRYVISGRLAPPFTEGVSELRPHNDEPVEQHPYVAARLVNDRDEPTLMKDHRLLVETVPLRFYDLLGLERTQLLQNIWNRGVVTVHGRWIADAYPPRPEHLTDRDYAYMKERMDNRWTWKNLADDEPFMQVFGYASGRPRLKRREDGGFDYDFRAVPSILRDVD